MTAHVTLALLEAGFTALTWWQLRRALGGNELSWMYVFEWPFFGVYAVYVWWRIVNDQAAGLPRPRSLRRRSARGSAGAPPAGATPVDTADPASPGEDRERAAYNRYLAALRAADERGSDRSV